MRRTLLALALAILAAVGTTLPVAAAQTSTAKVVIIVGATHGETSKYRSYADQLYAEAIQHTPNVVKVYSPYATWSAVSSAVNGANVVIYLGHGNGWPSPYTFDPNYTTKNGFGLNATAGNGDHNNKYYGEPSIKTLKFAPNALVLLFHLCYASGNSEDGSNPGLTVAKQRAANYASAFIAAGAAAVIADGHSHSPAYLRELFTKSQTLGDLWRSVGSYNGNDIAYTPVHTTTNAVIPGAAYLDPDNGGSSPSGFYRAFTGQETRSTFSVIGKLPVGKVTVDGRTDVSGSGTGRNPALALPGTRTTTSTPALRTSGATVPSRTGTSVRSPRTAEPTTQ